MTAEEAKAKVLAFTRRPLSPVVAIEEERGVRLLEVATQKELRFAWDDVAHVEEKTSALRPSSYLLVVLVDGRQVALADVGFAFAPSTANTGPLPEMPAVMCFRDLRHLVTGITQLLDEEGREREVLPAILLSIALLDGARATGFEVGREERALDALLRRLEERGIRL